MTVSTIASIATSLSRSSGNTSAKAASLFNSLFSSTSKSSAQDSANFSAAVTLQNQVAQFRVASQNVAQSSSLLAAAEQGATEIAEDLAKMKEIAARAQSPTLSDVDRTKLVSQFTALRARIEDIARSTKFNNESLLDGSSPQLKIASENRDIKNLSIGSLKSDALFKGQEPNISTPATAKAAEDLIKQAQTYANQQIENIRALERGLDFAAATLETAIQNNEASRSSTSDADFITQLLNGNSTPVDDIGTLLAQTRRMPDNLLGLLNE